MLLFGNYKTRILKLSFGVFVFPTCFNPRFSLLSFQNIVVFWLPIYRLNALELFYYFQVNIYCTSWSLGVLNKRTFWNFCVIYQIMVVFYEPLSWLIDAMYFTWFWYSCFGLFVSYIYTLESVLSDFVNMVCLVMELNGMCQKFFYVTEWCSISSKVMYYCVLLKFEDHIVHDYILTVFYYYKNGILLRTIMKMT